MTKKQLLKRIESLEACIGQLVDSINSDKRRISDLEEVVFDADLMLCEPTPISPNRDSN